MHFLPHGGPVSKQHMVKPYVGIKQSVKYYHQDSPLVPREAASVPGREDTDLLGEAQATKDIAVGKLRLRADSGRPQDYLRSKGTDSPEMSTYQDLGFSIEALTLCSPASTLTNTCYPLPQTKPFAVLSAGCSFCWFPSRAT